MESFAAGGHALPVVRACHPTRSVDVAEASWRQRTPSSSADSQPPPFRDGWSA